MCLCNACLKQGNTENNFFFNMIVVIVAWIEFNEKHFIKLWDHLIFLATEQEGLLLFKFWHQLHEEAS